MIEEFAIAQSQAEDDVKSHETLTREFEKVRQTAGRVYAFLEGHQEDRLAANQHYGSAADVLDRIGLQIGEPRGTSARCLSNCAAPPRIYSVPSNWPLRICVWRLKPRLRLTRPLDRSASPAV